MTGELYIGNMRAGSKHGPRPGDAVVRVDRANPVLGNRHISTDKRNAAERTRVIEAHRLDVEEAVEARRGPLYSELLRIAFLLREGKNVCLLCWCTPRRCHAENHRQAILRIVQRLEELSKVAVIAPYFPLYTDTGHPRSDAHAHS